MYGTLLRFMIEGYLQLWVNVCINLQTVSITLNRVQLAWYDYSSVISSAATVVLAFQVAVLPFLVVAFFYSYFGKLEKEEVNL